MNHAFRDVQERELPGKQIYYFLDLICNPYNVREALNLYVD